MCNLQYTIIRTLIINYDIISIIIKLKNMHNIKFSQLIYYFHIQQLLNRSNVNINSYYLYKNRLASQTGYQINQKIKAKYNI